MSRKERDQVLGHADENDGIEEYDNPLPDWWVGLFLFTIVWGIGYAVDYHFISHRSQEGAYARELAWADEKWPEQEASADLSEADLAEGREIFMANCIGCHGTDLRGGIGPNLTDTEWIHGGSFDEVVHTITVGVLDKGMLAWGPILGPVKIGKVAGFVLSQNTGEAPAEGTGGTGGTAAPTEGTDGGAAAPAEGTGEATGEAGGTPTDLPPPPPPGTPAEAGLAIFTTNCVVCHGANLKGGVGPDLTDDEWIHGGTPEEIKHTVTNGVLEKGMVQWGPILGEEKIDQVVAYVLHVNQASTSTNSE